MLVRLLLALSVVVSLALLRGQTSTGEIDVSVTDSSDAVIAGRRRRCRIRSRRRLPGPPLPQPSPAGRMRGTHPRGRPVRRSRGQRRQGSALCGGSGQAAMGRSRGCLSRRASNISQRSTLTPGLRRSAVASWASSGVRGRLSSDPRYCCGTHCASDRR